MGSDINIDELIEDKTSQFNIRRFWIGHTHFEGPEKSLDANKLTRDTFNTIKDNFKFREGTKIIKSFQTIQNLYNKYEDPQIQDFFFRKNWASSVPTVVNFTFNFNPFQVGENNALGGFFDYYHSHSDLLLTVPNIRIEKWVPLQGVYDKNGKQKYVKQRIITQEDYIKFIDSSYDILNKKNSKPIFVPISLRMKLGEIREILEHHLSKENYYYWIDFDAKSINHNTIGKLRHICNRLREVGYYDKAVFYFTNIKREIMLNAKNEQSEASDVLSSITGANLIGVNREPTISYEPPEPVPGSPPLSPPPNYKARLLDLDTYYYVKTDNPTLLDKSGYVPSNALRLDQEFANQTKHFLTDMSIRDYLNTKKMLKIYQNGNLLKELVTKEPSKTSLMNWIS